MEVTGKLFQFSFSPKLGRHLIAGRDIEAGEVIIDEPPVVEGPSSMNPKDPPFFCIVCYTRMSDSIEPCSACDLPLCSNDCSLKKTHMDNECRLFSKFHTLRASLGSLPKDLYNFLTICRALFLKSRCTLKWNQIMQLESKAEMLSEKHPSLFQRIDEAFAQLSWDDFDCPETNDNLIAAAHHCLGVLRTNAFSEFTEFQGREGLYFFSSFMAHSCVMNTGRQFDTKGSRVVVRAAIRIPKGQLITNTYLSCFSNNREREEELKTVWGFRCDCPRCESLTEMNTFLGSIKCPECHNLTLCPISKTEHPDGISWKCVSEHCEKTFSESDIEGTLEAIKKIQTSIPNLEEIGNLEQWLSDSVRRGVLHPNHSTFTEIKLFLCQSYGKQEGLESLSSERLVLKASYCNDVLHIIQMLFSGIYLFKGVILFELWTSLREILRRKRSTQCTGKVDPSLQEFQHADDDIVSKTAFDAYAILKYSIPGSTEDAMKNFLEGECQF